MVTERQQNSLPATAVIERSEEVNPLAFLLVLWHYKWLIVLGLACGLGIGYLRFLEQPSVFQSKTEILITKRGQVLPIESEQRRGQGSNSTYDHTHARLLRSPVIIARAVELHQLGDVPSLGSDAVSRIIGGLQVTGDGGPNGDIITFTYRSSDREECPRVLLAITDAYEEFLVRTYQDVSQETAHLISTAKDQLEMELAELEQAYRAFRETSPLVITSQGATNIHEARLSAIEAKRADVVLKETQIRAKFDAIHDALRRGSSREVLNLVVGNLIPFETMENRSANGEGGESGLRPEDPRNVERELFPMLLEEQLMLDRYGADHPRVTSIRKRISLQRTHLEALAAAKAEAREAAQQTEALEAEHAHLEKEPQRDLFEIYLESLNEEIRIAEQERERYDELFVREQAAAKQLLVFEVEEQSWKSRIGRKDRLFEAVLQRLEEINLMQTHGAVKLKTINPPGRGFQIEPKLSRHLSLAGMLGLIAGCGLAYLLHASDMRFRNAHDIQNDLGLPVVGHIPLMKLDRKTRDLLDERFPEMSPLVRMVAEPKGRIAEAYRAVRTALIFSNHGGSGRVLQVTSPSRSDGKSTLSANLAAAIAESGKRVLLVDCDFRCPRIHTYYRVDNSVGLSDVIAGESELADAIQTTAVANLEVLPCGPRPEKPAELLTGGRFQELLEIFREKYDFVLIDTPPVLVVTDAVCVATRVDGILLVMRLTKTARVNSRRAIETLDAVGGHIMGVVINGVGGRGGPGFGGYRRYGYADGKYGYGYRDHGYGAYGYGPGYDEYYEDSNQDSAQMAAAQVAKPTQPRTNGRI